GIGMDHSLDAMGYAGRVSREKSGIEAPHAARRGDSAGDQKQPGRVGQQACLAKRLPRACEVRRSIIARSPETKTGFFTGLANRGDCQRTSARGRDLGAALQKILLKRLWNGRSDGHAVIRPVDATAGKDEFAGHEHHVVVALADQNLWRGGATVDQDQRGGVHRAPIGMVIGFLFDLFSLAHIAPGALSRFLFVDANYSVGFCSSNPCMRSAHCTPTTAPFTGCSSSSEAISVIGK